MKSLITLEDLFNLSTAEIFNPDNFKSVNSVVIDSRKVKKGSLFIAIKGKSFDGHSFVKEVVEKGAAAVIVDRKKIKNFDDIDIPIITVKDTVKAFGEIAALHRLKCKAIVIAITGSNGKTGTKEIVKTLCSKKYKTIATTANNNNHIGVPLTLLDIKPATEVAVVEIGTNHFGEIEYTAAIAQPDIAVITNIGNSHLEFLKDKSGVLQEKKALLDITAKRGGTILINTDDSFLNKIKSKYSNTISYGFKGTPEVKAAIIGYTPDGKTRLEVTHKKISIKTVLNLYGESNAKNVLCAIAITSALKLTKTEINKGLNALTPAKQRLFVKENKKVLVIDDTYNANPDSMKSALSLLKNITDRQVKLAVLGDMFELGTEAEKYHRELAKEIKSSGVKELVLIGRNMKFLAEELSSSKITVLHFSKREQLKKHLSEYVLTDAAILFKGSRGMKMEEFIEALNPEGK